MPSVQWSRILENCSNKLCTKRLKDLLQVCLLQLQRLPLRKSCHTLVAIAASLFKTILFPTVESWVFRSTEITEYPITFHWLYLLFDGPQTQVNSARCLSVDDRSTSHAMSVLWPPNSFKNNAWKCKTTWENSLCSDMKILEDPSKVINTRMRPMFISFV